MNIKITNIGKRLIGLQKIALALGVFGGPLPPGESIVVPSEYVEKSQSEKSFTSLLGVDGVGAEIKLSDAPKEEAKPFAKVRPPAFDFAAMERAESDADASKRMKELEFKFAASLAALAEEIASNEAKFAKAMEVSAAQIEAQSVRLGVLETKLGEFETKFAEFETKLETSKSKR